MMMTNRRPSSRLYSRARGWDHAVANGQRSKACSRRLSLKKKEEDEEKNRSRIYYTS